MTRASRFKNELTRKLSAVPLSTPNGEVIAHRTNVRFGTPAGGHDQVTCWVYRYGEGSLEMHFGFYTNFSPDDLICKVTKAGEPIEDNVGATLQFNGNHSFVEDADHEVLQHSGRVTVRHAIKQTELSELIGVQARAAKLALGGISFPFVCGSTRDLESLLDRLFLYAYAIEQAKCSLRSQELLPPLPMKQKTSRITPPRAKEFTDRCVYTIRHSSILKDVEQLGGSAAFAVGQPWSQAKQLLDEARKNEQRVPVLFAAAEKTDRIIAWGLLDSISIRNEKPRTEFSFSHLKHLSRPPKKSVTTGLFGSYFHRFHRFPGSHPVAPRRSGAEHHCRETGVAR